MARTVLGSGTKYAPEASASWFIITATPSIAPNRASLDASTTFDVTAAVATSTGFQTGRNMLQETEWGSDAIPFTIMSNKIIDGTPTIEFWADRGGDDIRAELEENDTVAVCYFPSGDTPSDLGEVWLCEVADISLTKEKGSVARLRVQFAVQDLDPLFVIPAAA